jgi:hypothetical protein
MAKRNRRLSQRRKAKEKRLETPISVDNQTKRKKSLGALRKHQKTKPQLTVEVSPEFVSYSTQPPNFGDIFDIE